MSLQSQLMDHPLDGQIDVVAAAETILITARSSTEALLLAEHVLSLDLTAVEAMADTLIVIDTVYDGEDLDEVALLTGLDRPGVISAHSGQIWTAAFGGFAPGFAYLMSERSTLQVPRRSSPRTAVPAGSVALAGNYSAVYPSDSPGGWQLIGHTTETLWLPERVTPALVSPGNRVQFRAVRATARLCDQSRIHTAIPRTSPGTADVVPDPGYLAEDGVIVRTPGVQTTIQDLGRAGHGHLGVTTSGALDRGALRRANRLTGNPAGAAGLEAVLGGLCLEAASDQVVAVTGAEVALTITEPSGHTRAVPNETPFALLTGETLSLEPPRAGVRSYVAFRGGIDVPAVLGSRSTDTLSGTGPAPMVRDTRLQVLAAPPTSIVGNPESPPGAPADVTELRFVAGPRADWFTTEAAVRFGEQLWTVTPQSNRIGLRLDGEPLNRHRRGELNSEGTISGAVQIPPSGLPVLFLADHPVTGGYPVIGVVISQDLDKAAQLGAGSRIRFVSVPGAAAATALSVRQVENPLILKESQPQKICTKY